MYFKEFGLAPLDPHFKLFLLLFLSDITVIARLYGNETDFVHKIMKYGRRKKKNFVHKKEFLGTR